jgi:hypothetical protein
MAGESYFCDAQKFIGVCNNSRDKALDNSIKNRYIRNLFIILCVNIDLYKKQDEQQI